MSYGGPFLAGIQFEVTAGGTWFEGYWWWVCPSGQPTTAQRFALWNMTGYGSGALVPGSVVTSGTLAAGQWNWVPLPAPLPLAIATCYNACTGFSGSFPNTNNQFDSGGPYAAGITNGPLSAYSDFSGSLPAPYGTPQGVFGVAGTDPSVNMPAWGSNSANFWMDLQVSDTRGRVQRLLPAVAEQLLRRAGTSADDSVNYVVATEVHLSQPCTLNNIWYYLPAGTAQLATECGVWSIGTRELVTGNQSPSWSGAPGSGWVSCAFSGVPLSAGKYRVAISTGRRPGPVVPQAAELLGHWPRAKRNRERPVVCARAGRCRHG